MDIEKVLSGIRMRHQMRMDADFVENDHPRDKGGKFTSKGNESGSNTASKEKSGTTNGVQFKMKPCASVKNFVRRVSEAAKSCRPEDAWRVTVPESEAAFNSDHKDAKIYTTDGGSTCAVTPDGDIVSVCRKKGDKCFGADIMKHAVENGGRKLDSFSGNHDFYVKCGFEPVSWCGFSVEYAPDGWDKKRDKWEPVIFYKYTGRSREEIVKDYPNVKSFLKNVPRSEDYDTARNKRDLEMSK